MRLVSTVPVPTWALPAALPAGAPIGERLYSIKAEWDDKVRPACAASLPGCIAVRLQQAVLGFNCAPLCDCRNGDVACYTPRRNLQAARLRHEQEQRAAQDAASSFVNSKSEVRRG